MLTKLSVTSLLLPVAKLLGGGLLALDDRVRNELVRDFTNGLVFTMLGNVNIDGAKQTDKLCLSICQYTNKNTKDAIKMLLAIALIIVLAYTKKCLYSSKSP